MRTLEYILIIFSIIFLGSFYWTSSCFGEYIEPLWFESFEEFPYSGVDILNYSSYTTNPLDAFYSAGYDGWRSLLNGHTHGDFSLWYNELFNYSDFLWNAGNTIYESEEVVGGELFFDYYLSLDLSATSTLFTFTYGGQNFYYEGAPTPHTLFNYGEWNAVELEWAFDPFSSDQFVFGIWVNGNWGGLSYGTISQGEVSGFYMHVNPAPTSGGYVLVDNFRMYDTIDIVDPLEEPPEETDYPFLNWTDYYSSISEKFATSTNLFNNITGSFTPIINKMGAFMLYIDEYFDISGATFKGSELGLAIPKARGYLETIDDFISLPLSGFIVFFLLTMAVVVCYKVILVIIKLLKP